MLLRPYSLAHELWLIRESNTVLSPSISMVAVREHLPAAVLICCQTWEQLRTMRSDHLLALKLWLWRRRIKRLIKRVGQASSLSHSANPHKAQRQFQEQELAKFIAYRNDGLLEFPLAQVIRADSGPPPRQPGTPFILRLQQWLMTHLRMNEARAWDYPVGLAKMRWAAHWEAEGGLDVFNAHDAEESDFIQYWESRGGPGAMKTGTGFQPVNRIS